MLKAMNAKRHASLEATDAVAEKAFMVYAGHHLAF